MREWRLLAAILCGFPLVSGPGLRDGAAAAIPIKPNCRCCCCHGALSAAAAQQQQREARRAAERAEGGPFNFATFPEKAISGAPRSQGRGQAPGGPPGPGLHAAPAGGPPREDFFSFSGRNLNLNFPLFAQRGPRPQCPIPGRLKSRTCEFCSN